MSTLGSVILAGGAGDRAWPFNGIRQKVTLPVMDVPIVARLARALAGFGARQIAVVTGHGADAVKACLDGIPEVRFVESAAPSALAAAVQGLDALESTHALVCCGDIVTTGEKAGLMCEAALDPDREIAMLVAGAANHRGEYAGVETRQDGSVAGIRKARREFLPSFGGMLGGNTSRLANPLRRALNSCGGEGLDLWQGLARIIDDGVVMSTVYSRDFLVDVDMAWQLAEANYHAIEHFFARLEADYIHPTARVDDSAFIASGARFWLGESSELGRKCDIQGSLCLHSNARIYNGVAARRNVVFGRGAVAENYCGFGMSSVIGAKSRFGMHAAFMGYALPGVQVLHESQICAILGERVNVAAGVLTGNVRFDGGVGKQKQGERPVDAGAFGNMTIIGDHSQIGTGVNFHPGKRVGYCTCLGPGTLVAEDVPERSRTTVRQDVSLRPWNPERSRAGK